MINVVNVCGRRLTIRPQTGHEERMLLSAAKATQSGSDSAGKEALEQLIRTLVVKSEPELTFSNEVTGEEFDILYLIRLVSLGPLYEFGSACPYCKKAYDYKIDLRRLRRRVQLDPFADEGADPAVELKDYDIEDVCQPNILTVDLSAIPSDRAGTNPDLKFTLPVSGHKVTCKLPLVRDKDKVDRWMDQQDPRIISKQLAHMTISLDGVFDKGKLSKMYDDLTSPDRGWLRDQIAEAMPGVDTEIRVTCRNKKCGIQYPTKVDIAGNFFLPARAHLPDWFGSYLRSHLPIGDGQQKTS